MPTFSLEWQFFTPQNTQSKGKRKCKAGVIAFRNYKQVEDEKHPCRKTLWKNPWSAVTQLAFEISHYLFLIRKSGFRNLSDPYVTAKCNKSRAGLSERYSPL